MEELIKVLFATVPVWVTIVGALGVLFTFIYVNYKKVQLSEDSQNASIEQSRIQFLMEQIKMLSDELEDTRKQISELHEQNIELMSQLRTANVRISELEIGCNGCKLKERTA